jgi:exodeoxyribonuclease VII small subunit
MSQESATEREDITFETGYEELKGIVARLNDEDVSVHEMFEGFRRGKGLEQALRGYLTEREGELTEIEQGNNLPEFNIVAPSSPSPASQSEGEMTLGDQDFLTARAFVPDQPSAGTIEGEIPF